MKTAGADLHLFLFGIGTRSLQKATERGLHSFFTIFSVFWLKSVICLVFGQQILNNLLSVSRCRVINLCIHAAEVLKMASSDTGSQQVTSVSRKVRPLNAICKYLQMYYPTNFMCRASILIIALLFSDCLVKGRRWQAAQAASPRQHSLQSLRTWCKNCPAQTQIF